VVNSPFVRAGAAVTCASCGHRYLIDKTHIKRVPAAARADPDPGAQPSAQRGDSGSTATGSRPEGGGIQSLSEMMRVEAQRERDSRFDDYETIAPAADAPRKPIDPVVPEPPPKPKAAPPQKAFRNLYLAAAAAALVLAALGIGLLSMNWELGTAVPNPPETEPGSEPGYEGPMYQGLPLAESVALGHSPWEQPNRPFQSQPQQNPEVYVADDGLKPSDAGPIEYVGRVVSEDPGVIVAGELSISLVNPQGMEKARTRVPFALVSPGQSMGVRLPIPANLDPTALNPVWSITVNEVLDPRVLIEDVSVEIESVGADTMARIVLGSGPDGPLQRAVLLVTAWDAQAQPLRRWRVRWQMPIAGGDYVEFYARTAVTPSWRIDAWTVQAVGEPSPVLPPPDPAGAQAD
jgi:hypothetical protein